MGRHQATKRLTGQPFDPRESLDKLNGSKILRVYSGLSLPEPYEFFCYKFQIL
jgi:hypothetical protein